MSIINPVPCTPSGGGAGGPEFDVMSSILCDVLPDGTIAGTALAVYDYHEETGLPVGPPTFVDPVTGNPYVAQGILKPCDEPCAKCDTVVMCDTATTPASETVASTMRMLDTANVVGDDGWNVTQWNTGNAVNSAQTCVGVQNPPVPVPYPMFYSADWCAAFLAACPGATPAGAGCALNPGPALGLTAGFQSVQCGVGVDFASACSRYIIEKTFNTDAACTKIRVTSQRFRADGSAKVLIDGQATGIYGQYNVSSPDGTIILTLAPGPHVMTIDLRDSNSPTWVQGGLTIECLDIVPAGEQVTQFLRTTCRSCTGKVISTTDTALDGTTPYVPQPGGAISVCSGGGSSSQATQIECDSLLLIDTVTNNGITSCVNFLRTICHNPDGTFNSVTDTLPDGTSPYTAMGNVGIECAKPQMRNMSTEVLCDDNGPFLRQYVYGYDDAFIGTNTTLLDGDTVYVPSGIVHVYAADNLHEFTTVALCDDNGVFTRTFHWDGDTGLLTGVIDQDALTQPYVPVGVIKFCGADCCPTILGSGCATGGRKWTALRNTDGTVILLNQATGAAVLPADVIACADVNAIALPVVAAHHFNAIPSTPWAPAAIPAGRLVSLTYTVLSGTATVIDADGTNIAAIPVGYTATWAVQDDRETLVPPASITAAAASRVLVLMNVATP